MKEPIGNRASSAAELQKQLKFEVERRNARELIRIQQQGLGRPIIATKHGEHQFVAVGSTVHFSRNWKFFTDFLSDYIKRTLGGEWGNAEIAKPFEHRHPIMQWYNALCRFQRQGEKDADGAYFANATGVVFCYLGLAYNLYLLKHNAELQAKLIARLKNIDQFQGAYYELIVANCLIRAGFELTIEDEDSRHSRHCEFAAVSKQTGARYSVEAKMRSVAGLLGKTDGDPTADPASKLIKHLNDSLGKPSNGERLIFIDVNAEPIAPGAAEGKMPAWMERAGRKLDQREATLELGQRAYVFVTNMAFHRVLENEARGQSALAHGLGFQDFAKAGEFTFVEAWKQKQKHIDAHRIFDALNLYPQIPNTFGGELPMTEAARANWIEIGQTYSFGPEGMRGEVTAASISPETKKMIIGVTCDDGQTRVLFRDVTDEEIAAYRAHPDAYFGVVRPAPRNVKTAYELFERFVEGFAMTTRERLLELAKDAPDIENLKKLSQQDLLLELCQRWAAAAEAQSEQNPSSERPAREAPAGPRA